MPAAQEEAPARESGSSVLKLGMSIFLVALSLRLLFGRLIADTYDYDEFVLLLLGRDFAHGAVPYRDFMFFHPPGALVLLRILDPITSLWWPWARIFTSALDSATAAMVFIVGSRIFDRRVGIAAGLAYAASPLALVSSVRIGQDPLTTVLGMLGVTALLMGPERRWALTAGVCLGLATWTKYPALYFAPVYLLLAPRRFPFLVVTALCTFFALVAPFSGQLHLFYAQTVTFQHARWTMPLNQRLATTAVFWIGLNALAFPALVRRTPTWLAVGFGLGGLFVFVPQVYYHYFVPVVPFAALLTGLTLTRIRHWHRTLVIAAVVFPAVLAAAVIDSGGYSPLYVTAARLSDVAPTVRLLETKTTRGESVLADRFEYAYLARRPAFDDYFWNIGVLVNAAYLESRVDRARAVVLSSGASSGYPSGFTTYLNRRYKRVQKPTTTVWLLPRSRLPG
jgi:hypothetical protein